MEAITKVLRFLSTVKNKDTLLRFFQFANKVIVNSLGNSVGKHRGTKIKIITLILHSQYITLFFVVIIIVT